MSTEQHGEESSRERTPRNGQRPQNRRPHRDSDHTQRRDGERKPRRDGEYKPRRDDDRKPRRDGEWKPRQDRDAAPRRDGDFKPRREGEWKPRRDDDRKPRRDGEWKPRRDDDRKPRREGDWKPRQDRGAAPRRDGDFKPRREGDWKPRRDDDRKPRRDGEWKPRRDDDRKPRREGDWKPRQDRDAGPRRDGDFKPRREGEWKPRREGDFKPRRDGEWKPRRDDDRKPRRDGEWKPRRDDRDSKPRYEHSKERERSFEPRDRKYRGGDGRERSFAETDGNDFRPVREHHTDPEVPEFLSMQDLHPSARNELKTLDKQHAESVALHLAAVAHFIDDDPERAHQHAISAMRRAARIPVTRETYAITSYITGDYATALRELRTFRRLTGSDMQLALMIDAERALGRPEKGVEAAREVDTTTLPTEVQVQVAIAMSGARLDMGQTQQALFELEIPQLDPKRAYSWSPELFAAYAIVLEDLGRSSEASEWRSRAFAAEEALEHHRRGDVIEIMEIEEEPNESTSEGDN